MGSEMCIRDSGKTGKMHLKCSFTLAEIKKILIRTTKYDFSKNINHVILGS